MKAGKVWGVTEQLLATPGLEVHRVRIKKGGYCSTHKHNRKWNAFIVLDGTLTVEVVQDAYALTDRTYLERGELMTVRPGALHRFKAEHGDVVALELYYPDVLGEDIDRQDVGGREGV